MQITLQCSPHYRLEFCVTWFRVAHTYKKKRPMLRFPKQNKKHFLFFFKLCTWISITTKVQVHLNCLPLLRQTYQKTHINFIKQTALKNKEISLLISLLSCKSQKRLFVLSRSVSCSDLVAVLNFIESTDMHSAPFACKRFSWMCQRKHRPPKRSGAESLYTILTKNIQIVSDQQPDIQAPYEPRDVRPG